MGSICFCTVAVLWVQFFMVCSPKVVTNITTDQSTLLEFKARITSSPQNILAQNWSTSTSICQWVGVFCSARHERVTALNLSNMSLQGTISPHLGNLSFLTSLNVASNNLHGPIPKELGQLPRLKEIVLSYNSFSGTIPSTLFNMSKLEILNLRYNLIEGNISLEEALLPNLKVLDLVQNKLSGSLPDGMCKSLAKLQTLKLTSNGLHGQLPTSLGSCSELQTLSFGNNKFVGTIPRSIGNLTQLRVLNLTYCELSGDIPKEMGNLLELEVLAMMDAGVVGPIPSFIFNISSLKQIDLHRNGLDGSLPVDICQHLPVLTGLWLGENMLTGRIPKNIGNCTLLESLWLGPSYLTGEIPREVGNLQNLEELTLISSNLTGIIPSVIFNMSTLKTLALYENQLAGNLPASIGHTLPNLEILYLWGNELGGQIPSSISNASKLTGLSLGTNSFTGYIPTTLGNLRSLQELFLQSNYFSSDPSSPELGFLSSLTNCANLRFLELSWNPLNGVLPSSIGNLSTALEHFIVRGCGLKGGIPPEIGNLSNIIHINLIKNELTGSVPSTISRLQTLQDLVLHNNKLQGQIPSELCRLQRIRVLHLGDNMLNGSIPTCIGNTSTLRYLYLQSNRLHSTIPSTLWSLTYILQVRLNSNSLSGFLSSEVGRLNVLMTLDVSENQLSGNIPNSIGDLRDLSSLSLAENGFEGPIPKSFDALISLESLDLSDNNLSGGIPKSLEKLKYLSYFNVSFNKLEGEIPKGGPFVNFSYQSFLSNDGLCGSPQLRVTPCKTNKRGRSKRAVTLLLKYILPVVASTIFVVFLIFILVRSRIKRKKLPTQESLLPLATWRRVSYQELRQATNGFSESNLLGTGSFSSVYTGTLSDGTNTAIKVFNLQLEEAFQNFEAECEVMRNIRHRNLVKIISSCSNSIDFRALVLELMPNGSLEKWLYSGKHFLEIVQRINIMQDVASALEYLHQGYSTPVVHCDLKPSNILLDEDMVAHVSDFGITKLLGEGEDVKQTITLATIGYMAPEYGLSGIVSTRSDVYSFGILLMEILTRKKPTDEMFVGGMSLKSWVKESLAGALHEVVDADLLKEEDISKLNCIPSLMELALACTEDSPEERTNMSDALVILKKIKKKLLKEDINQREVRFPTDLNGLG